VRIALGNTPEPGSTAADPEGGGIGQHSRLTSNQVLVIVDRRAAETTLAEGAPDLAQHSHRDIEKFEVLRSGASAVYGADAMGGVIVITTKKSGASRLSISVR